MKKAQSVFIHNEDDIVYNRIVNGNKLTRSVEGYDEPCKTCNLYPAFEYNSKNKKQIKVITCDHSKEKVKSNIKIYA